MERRISVIIPTRQRQADLTRCLASIRACDCTGLHEIIVVDDGSKKPPRIEVVFPAQIRVRLMVNPTRRGPAWSRNAAASQAEGEILAFLDDDVLVGTNWFCTVLLELTPERAAITGPVLAFDSSVIARARQSRYDQRYRGKTDGQVVDFLAGGNSAIWREEFMGHGGFPCIDTMSDKVLAEKLFSQTRACHFIWQLKIRHRNSKGIVVAIAQAFKAGVTTAAREKISIRAQARKLAQNLCAQTDSLALHLVNGFLQLCFLTGHCWYWSTKSVRVGVTTAARTANEDAH